MDSSSATTLLYETILGTVVVAQIAYIGFKLSVREKIDARNRNVPNLFYVLPFPVDFGVYVNHLVKGYEEQQEKLRRNQIKQI